jgi:homocysteine S-methyltransferase
LRACTAFLQKEPQIVGVGVNCTPPALITSLIAEMAEATAKPILVYPNSGEGWDAVGHCWQGDGQMQAFGEQARAWRTAGAQWIGGCCRTGPEHVRAVAAVWGR